MASSVLRKLCRRVGALAVRGTATATGCPSVDETIRKLPELIHETIVSWGRSDETPISEFHSKLGELLNSRIGDPTTEKMLELYSENNELVECSRYLFDGRGKAVRPTMILLMAGACNFTQNRSQTISSAQRTVAMVAEMIHTASLIHDDIIDDADTRRGRPSINRIWGEKKALLTGNFIVAQASHALACMDNSHVIELLSSVAEDIVHGEVMQLTVVDDQEALFQQYLQKTFKKTASPMALACQAVAILSGGDDNLCQSAFQYGKNVGLAFQVVDDTLDFQSSSLEMGKPTTTDLRLGLANAPVLYAAEEKPELYVLIKRQFKHEGDVEQALSAVRESNALSRSHQLAKECINKGVAHIQQVLADCREKDQLEALAASIINRSR